MKWADPDELSAEDFAAWFNAAPTQRQVEDYERGASKRERDKVKAQRRADWRARHPLSTCSDRVADLLAELEEMCRPSLQRAGEAA